jgi:hypothetical protein
MAEPLSRVNQDELSQADAMQAPESDTESDGFLDWSCFEQQNYLDARWKVPCISVRVPCMLTLTRYFCIT